MSRLEMLVEVCTGAGKSQLAQMFLVEVLLCSEGQYKRGIVIIPKNNALREQWENHCKELQRHFSLSIHVCYMDDQRLSNTGPEDVAVVDECHHVCKQKSWGRWTSEQNACGVFLLLSATPWHGRNQMAFRPETIYTYKYRQAEEANIVRRMHLVPSNAEVCFTHDGQERRELFFHPPEQANVLDKRPDSLRYAAAAKMSDDFEKAELLPCEGVPHEQQLKLCQSLVDKAVKQLKQLQRQCARAQGIIFAYAATDMEEIESYMKSSHDVAPLVIRSDKAGCVADLHRFRENKGGNSPWAIVLNKVAEGVDIPTACVGVYTHKFRAPLFITQAAGRLIRRDAAYPQLQDAYLFYPKDPKVHTILCEQFNKEDEECPAGPNSDAVSEASDCSWDGSAKGEAGACSSLPFQEIVRAEVSSDEEDYEAEDVVDRLHSSDCVDDTEDFQQMQRVQLIQNLAADLQPIYARYSLTEELAREDAERRLSANPAGASASYSQAPALMSDAFREKKLRSGILRELWRCVYKHYNFLQRCTKCTSKKMLWSRENMKLVKRCRATKRKANASISPKLRNASYLKDLDLPDLAYVSEVCLPARKCKLRKLQKLAAPRL
jgi:hypothetical protein